MADLVALRPTGRGAALLVVSLAALAGARASGLVVLHALGVLLLVLAGVTAAAAVACAVGLRLGPARACRWQVPAYLQEGQTLTAAAVLSLPWWCLEPVVTLRVVLVPAGEEDRAAEPGRAAAGRNGTLASLLRLTPDDDGRVTATLSAGTRGLLRLDLLRLETTGLLGLWHLRAPVRASVSRPVRPAGAVGPSVGVRSLLEGGAGGGRGDGGEELGRLRPYQVGDALSRVHWRQSARTGEIVVVEPEDGTGVLRVVLDRRAGSYRSRQEAEEAVRVAAGLVAAHDGPVRLQCLPAWQEPAGVLDAAAALDLLARVPLVAQEPHGWTAPGATPPAGEASTQRETVLSLYRDAARSSRREVTGQVGSAVVVLAAWWAGLDSLTVVLEPGTWQVSAFAVLAAAVLGALAARLLRGRRRRGRAPGRWNRLAGLTTTVTATVTAGLACALAACALAVAVLDPPRWWLHRPLRLVGDAVELAQRYPAPMPVDLTTTLVLTALAAVAGTVTVLVGALGGDRSGLTVLVPGACLLAAPLAAELTSPPRDLAALGVCLLLLLLLHAPGPWRPLEPRWAAAQATLAATSLVLAAVAEPLAPVGGASLADRLAGLLPQPQVSASATPSPATPSRSAGAPGQKEDPPPAPEAISKAGEWEREAVSGVVPDLTVALDHDLLTAPDVPVLAYRTRDARLSGQDAADSGLGIRAGAGPRLVLGVVRDLDGQAWTPLEETDGVPVTAPPGAQAGTSLGGEGGAEAAPPLSTSLDEAAEQAAAQAAQAAAQVSDQQTPPTLEVRILALRSTALPLLTRTVSVQPASGAPATGPTTGRSALARWEWVSEAGTALAGGTRTQDGMTYAVSGWSPALADDGSVVGAPLPAAGASQPPAGASASGASPGQSATDGAAGAAGATATTGTASGPVPASLPVGSQDWLAAYQQVDEELLAVLGPRVRQTLSHISHAGLSPLEQAAVVASWFHGNSFVYDAAAPGTLDGQDGTPAQVLAEFVRTRHGYCIHYAATFTVMARSIGIPTRIAVGLAPSAAAWREADGEGWVPLSARSLHAWPQVWDPAAGWVSVEPTPGAAGGVSAPGAVLASSSQDPDVVPSPARLTRPQASSPATQDASPDGVPGAAGQRLVVVGVLLAAGLLTAGWWGYRRWRGGTRRRQGQGAGGRQEPGWWLGPRLGPCLASEPASRRAAAWRWRRVQRRLQRSARPAEAAWRIGLRVAGRRARAVTRASGVALPRPRALTEQARAEALAALLAPQEAAALTRLADAVVAERYGAPPNAPARAGATARRPAPVPGQAQALAADLAVLAGLTPPGTPAGSPPSARTR